MLPIRAFDPDDSIDDGVLLVRSVSKIQTVFRVPNLADMQGILPYGHLPGGTPESVESITLADAQAYAKEHYILANTSMYISGPLTTDAFSALFDRAAPLPYIFQDSATTLQKVCDKRGNGFVFPGRSSGETLHYQAAVDQTTAVLAWPFAPEYQAPIKFDLWALKTKISAAFNRSVSCNTFDRDFGSFAYCSFDLNEGEELRPMSLRANEIARTLWSELYLQKWWGYFEYWRLHHKSSAMGSAGAHGGENEARFFHRTGRQDWLNHEANEETTGNTATAAKAGEIFLHYRNVQLAIVEPEGSDTNRPPPPHDRRSARPLAVKHVDVDAASLDNLIAEPNWTKVHTLPNGLKVAVFYSPQSPLFRAQLMATTDGQTRAFLDTLTWRSLPDVSSENMVAAVKDLGALQITRDDTGWIYRARGKDSGKMMELLRDVIDHQKVKKRAKISPSEQPISPHQLARSEQIAQLYGTDASQRTTLEQAAKAIPLGQLQSRSRRILKPENSILVIHGPLPADDAMNVAYSSFAHWKGPGGPQSITAEAKEFVVEPSIFSHNTKNDAPQTTLVSMCRLTPTTPSVTTAITTEAVRRQLNHLLRTTEGVTYGVHADSWHDASSPVMEIYSNVDNGAVQMSIDSFQQEIRRFAESGLSPEQLAIAKRDVAVSIARRLQETDQMMTTMGWLEHYASADRASFGTQLDAITAEDVANALSSCTGHEVFTVVGPNAEAQNK